MGDYRSVKELVIETYMSEGGIPSYDALTGLVLEHFPKSKWQKTHYAYYKSQIKTGKILLPGLDGTEISTGDESVADEVEESINVSLSLERDLHSYLSTRISEIEKGLVLLKDGIEYRTDAGRIDLLAKDAQEQTVVIELKAGKAKDSALGQLLGYMGCLSQEGNHGNTRGILVASDFEQRVVFAAKGLENVKLVRYCISFDLQEVGQT